MRVPLEVVDVVLDGGQNWLPAQVVTTVTVALPDIAAELPATVPAKRVVLAAVIVAVSAVVLITSV